MSFVIRFFVFFLTVLIFSCAPLKRESPCKYRFDRIKENSSNLKDFFIRGNIFVHGAYLVFYGNVGKEKSDLTVRLPFGKKLFSVLYSNDTVCFELPEEEKVCGKGLDMYWDYLGVKLPVDIRELLTGKMKISDDDRFFCKKDELIVENKNRKMIYKRDRLSSVEFDNVKINYFYEDERINKIVVYEKGKEVGRIYIREIRER